MSIASVTTFLFFLMTIPHCGTHGNVTKANSSPGVPKSKRSNVKRPRRCISNPVVVCFGSASWEAESFLLSHRTWLKPKRLFVGGGMLLEQTLSLRQEHFQNVLSCQHRRCGDLFIYISQHSCFRMTLLDVLTGLIVVSGDSNMLSAWTAAYALDPTVEGISDYVTSEGYSVGEWKLY